MASQPQARGQATRLANKLQRRDHILGCAATMIAREGIDALTLARLAERADVTVPTVHNLLGRKSDLLETLVVERMRAVMDAGTDLDHTDPIATVESFATSLLALLASDEPLYRAAFIAGERIGFFEQKSASGIFARSVEEAIQVCRDAVDQGLLEGRIDPARLATRLFASQRLARQDWMNGYIQLAQYRIQMMGGMFITLCADAGPAFKDRLIARLDALEEKGLEQ
ncbi:TetR/AcrR family transcriptional regulator [Qipengyuania qiaonensis]|uniref:TetR family transcriptional regulator n=1 Tax=Qipengyuania qiaonensis TaxID=2867240 RepID=A0ABS7J629_9SPHN|nr:TetR family transcriptional regulator [Qipengyuania qiaonensis]MBX7482721.1 TetR family transcriptional regulator [Qipengyuania qiaonensis]